MPNIEVGSRVRTRHGDIDNNLHANTEGVVEAIVRFSKYHNPEAVVRFQDGRSSHFWILDLDLLP